MEQAVKKYQSILPKKERLFLFKASNSRPKTKKQYFKNSAKKLLFRKLVHSFMHNYTPMYDVNYISGKLTNLQNVPIL